MPEWPESKPHHDGERKEFNFDNGYTISLVKFTGSYGYKKGLWELSIINKDGKFTDTADYDLLTILEDYSPKPGGQGIYGFLRDPDADRIIQHVKKMDYAN
jgi:hypothetical protein